MNGRRIVILIVAVGVLGVAASGWYRSRARERLLQNLGNANLRAEAFSGLLRANGLWGLAQDAVYDPRVPETMSPYLRAQDAGGRVWHVLQISKVDRERNVDGAFVVFDEHGTLEGVFEQTRAVPLLAGPEYALVALVKTSDDQPQATHSILLVGQFVDVLRMRGDFRLRTVAGLLDSRTWALAPDEGAPATELPPVFHYDRTTHCFRGPPGGPEEPWEVDRGNSPKYCDEA